MTINCSVIIPVWNPGPAISRCVESLRGQTLEDIEMIFVDDCGTDGAMDIVRAAAAEDPRIRIIVNPKNLGLGVTLNRGLAVARGEYISVVDSDDYVNAVFLERLYAKAVANKLDIVKGKHVYERENESITEYPNRNEVIRKGLQAGKPLFLLLNYQHQSVLYRRAWLLKYGICFGTSRRAQDVTFLLKSCHRAERFDFEESAEYHFCEREGSLMHDMRPHTLERRLHAFQERMDYIVENMANEEYVSQYVGNQVHYDLRLCNELGKRQECREACDSFIAGLREQVLRFPQLEKLKSEFCIVRVLIDYGVALSHQPFKLPWEDFKAESYVETIRDWIDFVNAHPECLNAAEKDLFRLFREAETLCRRGDSWQGEGHCRMIRQNLSAQAARLPFRCQSRIYEENPDLPRPLAFIAKRKLKAMKWRMVSFLRKNSLSQ